MPVMYTAEEEQALMARIWSPEIKEDPEKFVMLMYPWGQKGTPLEHFTGPRKWQRRLLRKIRDHIAQNKKRQVEFDLRIVQELVFKMMQEVRVSGRGIGKSALFAWLGHWFQSCFIGSTVIVSANSENQLRTTTLSELSKWVMCSLNAHWWDIQGIKMVPQGWLCKLVEEDLKKGTKFWFLEGKLWSEENPDAYAGPHNMDGLMVLFDEASGIPDAIWSVAKGFFTENTPYRFWLGFSNGRRNAGYFYEACEGNKRDFWGSESIDAREVEGTDKAVYEEIIAEYGEDSDEARIEVYGQFPEQGDDQFISPKVVDDAFKRTPYRDPSAPLIMGVDPARSGADSTVIRIRQGRDCHIVRRLKGYDTMQVVGFIIEIIREYHPHMVNIDEGGLGYGIVDRLKEQKFKVNGVNFGGKTRFPKMYANKRAEMWGELRKWLKTASITEDKRLKTDLTNVKQKDHTQRSSGAILLEAKADMKRRGCASPDDGDALALTFALPVGKVNVNAIEADDKYSRSGYGASRVSDWMGA